MKPGDLGIVDCIDWVAVWQLSPCNEMKYIGDLA